MKRTASALSTILVAALLAAAPASAQLVYNYFVVPVVAKAPGLNDTSWQSDVVITNVSAQAAKLGVQFCREEVANTFNGSFEKTVNVAANQAVTVTDVLGTWFPEVGDNAKGFLVIADITPVDCTGESPPSAYPYRLIVSSRTYNTGDPDGTFGTAVDTNFAAGNGTNFPSIITGVRYDGTDVPGYRSNLAVANVSTARLILHVRIAKKDGSLAVPEQIVNVEPLSYRQWSLADFGITSLGPGGRVEIRNDDTTVKNPCQTKVVGDSICADPCHKDKCPNGYGFPALPTFIAWVTKVDNGTGDGELVAAVIDWLEYSEWSSDYKKANCPSSANTLSAVRDALGATGLGRVIKEPVVPTFRKVKR